ncbi:MAG: hypothetical protein UX87_C0032G0007 [Candidatus Amesbacteria bacterium GW2011_GWA1_47_16]|uniref:Uncharacterized protein n=4 Tax=Candidatus Amesiibacteriota TaxID=1752730 RepID=A0A0G1S1I3_9BACT|nr:MAG: hypothetical protein UX87_C0032G0007 [Candidatus Amesbacteria bacterium GW2011_GWA1_47_16]KKU63177.1 MAG: hypothetical protein UX86_C0031G0007 [Candidatus Amesbacteria bacterium GW2011_GWC1_47_15]KKU97707.1 MAG: hypothetical protein UY28_C0016G0016 [Candidatus Amesbacteria bacterium GW2011_GWB1_48_13]OGC97892.1 MAG: hypothetical protein A2701_03155 [Candidatus Amesbacteria bacterium RIFCSPHIGHO2_01_FULL_47_34]OGD01398.1 MAG: hypothetical protein A2972_04200 [Candidatus Amesbacteria bact
MADDIQIPNTSPGPAAAGTGNPTTPITSPQPFPIIGEGADTEAKKKAGEELAAMTKDPVPGLAQEIEEFEEKQEDWQAMYNAGGKFKEQLEAISRNGSDKETEPKSDRAERKVIEVEEIPTSPELEKKPELKGYIEKVETDTDIGTGVTDDYTQTVLMGTANPQKPTVILPLTDDQVQQGLHHQVWEAIRWLAVWCVRQIKMLGGRAKYKD